MTRRIAGETLLVPIYGDLANMEKIFALDPVAAFIWEKLDGKRDLEAICDQVLAGFEVERRQVEADVQEFVTELIEGDLITEVTDTG